MKSKQKINQYSPISAIDSLGIDTKKISWFEQKKKLPRNIRYGLLSKNTEELIKTFCQKYKIVLPEKIGGFSITMRNFVAGDLSEEELRRNLVDSFQLDNVSGASFLEEFKKLANEIKKVGTEEVKKDLVALDFKTMLEKFPEVSEEEIGVSPIIFPGEAEPQAPSIMNWISDYKLRKGDNQETPILNVGDYLYNSKNVQELDDQEKESLGLILEAYEKNLVVYYNTLFEEIDFEIMNLLKDKPKKEKEGFSVKKMESKPFHETDSAPSPSAEKNITENFSQTESEKSQKVLDLKKYV